MPSDRIRAFFCVWPTKAESQIFLDNRSFPCRLNPKRKRKVEQTGTTKENAEKELKDEGARKRIKGQKDDKQAHCSADTKIMH